jgi:xanthine dehydrogenase small subunit
VAARAPTAEGILTGAPWSRATFEAAAVSLAQDFQPLSDMRASSDYRMSAAANLLRRYFLSYEADTLVRVADVVP